MSVEDELKQLDFEIRRLKVQYDLFFNGASPRPPNDQREALARQIRRYQGVSLQNFAERFLYSQVVNKFNTFQELWNKLVRIKEEGARVHPLATRHAVRSAAAEKGGSTSPVAALASEAARAPKGAAARRGGPAAGPPSWTVGAESDEGALRGMYDSFLAARKAAGDARPLAFETFTREVHRYAQTVRSKSDCERVEFRIYSHDNKVSLKARPGSKG